MFSASYKKTKIAVGIAALVVLAFFMWLQPRSSAYETVFYGGPIITMDPAQPIAEALLMRSGKIIAVGDLASVRAAVFGDATEINLGGKTLMPGLIEPHSHTLATAILGETIDVSGFTNKSRSDIIKRLKLGVKATPKGRWVMAYGWDPVMMPDLDAPTLAELDALSPTRPLLILTQMMHDAYANSAALAAAGITAETPNPAGAEFVKDANGALTGTVREVGAIERLFKAAPAPPDSAANFLLARQFMKYARAGYTTVATLGPVGQAKDPVASLHYIARQTNAPIRSLIYALPSQVTNLDGTIQKPQSRDIPAAVIGVKFWMDGSPFAGGAAFKAPYETSELTTKRLHLPARHMGPLNWSDADFAKSFRRFHDLGYQLAFHVQGERAVDQVLNTAEKIFAQSPRADNRYRLEHNALITKEQLERAAKLGMTTSFFIDHIYYYGHALPDLVGEARTKRYMPVKTALDSGLRVSVHTDNPATPIGPLRAMQTLRARKSHLTGAVIGPDQKLTPMEALQAMTINAAWQLGLEKETGSLIAGKSADLLMLSANPLETPDEDLQSIKVLGTWLKGEPADIRPLNPTTFKTGIPLMFSMIFN